MYCTKVTREELGGTTVHCGVSGVGWFQSYLFIAILNDVRIFAFFPPITLYFKVAHQSYDTDLEVLRGARELFDFLPLSNREAPPQRATADSPDRLILSLQHIIPPDPSMPYDIKGVIENVVDDRNFYELMPDWARNIVIGFGEEEETMLIHRWWFVNGI